MEAPVQDVQRMTAKRPTMNDPAEFKIIRDIYLIKDSSFDTLTDTSLSEHMERQASRQKQKTISSR